MTSRTLNRGRALGVMVLVIAVLSCWDRVAASDEGDDQATAAHIGFATMLADGTIQIDLVIEERDLDLVGERRIVFTKRNPGYEKVRARLGLERAGQSVDVLPWPASEDGGPPPDDADLELEPQRGLSPGR